jgi:hypothetical protein
MKIIKTIQSTLLMAIVFYSISGCATTYPSNAGAQYSNPSWAPPYAAGVRYYYLPDIETYYDLSNNDFVYLDDGQWIFANSLPVMYSNYDLYNGFSIALNYNVYQPWMHNQYYASNYPRYYYRTKYQGTQNTGIRGFNENQRQPVFNKSHETNRTSQPNQHQSTAPTNNDRKPVITRPAQNPVYPGRNVGQPVKVTSGMRQNRPNTRNGNGSENSNGGNRENNRNERPH